MVKVTGDGNRTGIVEGGVRSEWERQEINGGRLTPKHMFLQICLVF